MKKRNFKFILLPLLAVFTLFLLGACGQEPKKSYLQLIKQEKKIDSRVIIEYQGDKILSTNFTNTIYYERTGFSEEQFKKSIDEYDEKHKDMKGLSHSAEYKDGYFIEKTIIDYTKADIKELQEHQFLDATSNQKVDYVSYKITLKTLESNGFKEVENGKFEELK
ncbi:DUF1307 domain-containing protein [uncultured Neisseria sp.]|uniref:DUF1307 domain-containing protein n=1 Tax=uncultured Neisseria sp. TaxID=237778 RepID=UPI0025E27AE1|nr:DUF1307 domain-containing protein [uncultured Neisseria sp.]